MTQPDEDGWQATFGLRFLTPPRTTTKAPCLQQRWIKIGTDRNGYSCVQAEEWRSVPLVVGKKDAAGV